MFPRSVPGQALVYIRAHGVLLTTQALVTELRDVLNRPKFDRYVSKAIRDEFLAGYINSAEFAVVTQQVTVVRDPKDDQILDAAINGAATCIVSGDKDLLALGMFRGIPILSPADFLARA